MKPRLGILHGVCLWLLCGVHPVPAAPPPRVDVILWFDTEDYLSPADDDACKRLATMLTERHIRATFKVVGEKARVLERRGRRDVIEALQKHDIGFHANFHSVHPTPTEYLADCSLLDGMAEFERREGPGAADVRRVFHKETLVCYGQPGSSWAAQAVAGLKQIGVAPSGVPCYVDEGEHVGLDHKPFWFADALNVYHMGPNYTRMELHDPAAVEPAKQKVSEIARRLQTEDGGGLISIFYHPCEWIHLEFWDGVNFRRGANPPPEQWKAPPQQPPAETEAAFGRFAQYIDHIRSIPGVRFITAGDLPSIYADPLRKKGAPEQDVFLIAKALTEAANGVDYIRMENRVYSPADQFELLATLVSRAISGHKQSFPVVLKGLLGPDQLPPGSNPRTHLDWPAFRMAAVDVENAVETEKRVPARVFIGPDPVPPAVFLVGLARVCRFYGEHGRLPTGEGVELPARAEVLTERYVAEDTPGLFGGWIIHKEGFRAPKVMEVARLQAWTLKPALRVNE
ncbi:MAG TPA: hypothetical protein VKY92_05010 [Verrucomicrobiae bacterium]|nr:hypothetical protein [Verrucomicrobiae bacterium]